MRHRPFKACVSLSLSLWTGLTLPLGVWAETDWYTLKANGQIIGKVGIHSYPAQGDQVGTITEVSNVNHFTRQGSPFEVNTVSRFVESPEGHKPLSFSYRYEMGDQQLLAAHGSLNNNALDLRMTRENTESAGKTPITGDQFLFPGGEGIKRIYSQHYTAKPGERFSYQTLHLGVQPQVVNTEVTTLGREKLALATGERKPVRKYELTNPADRDKKIYEWRDARGKLYKSQSVGMNGMEMVYASQREVRQIDQNTVDLVNTSAVLSNIIPQPRVTTEALYKISPLTGRNFDVQSAFPESFTQKRILPKDTPQSNESALYLKVRQKEPTDSLTPFPIAYARQYLQATPYMQVSDPQLDQTALAVVGDENRAYYAARKLQQWVYKNIAYKDLTLGFASAKETFQRRQGDCTEHAVLLASLLRSLGIPSRVAIGLIYLPNQDSELGKFVFHMWTEAYIGSREQGDWVPLDATNPEPLPDATHIKLADSALTNTHDLMSLTEQVIHIMGKVRLDVVKALSPSQSVLSVEGDTGITAVKIPAIDITRFDIQALSRQSIKRFRIDLPPSSLSADTPNGLFTSGLEAQSQGNAAQAKQYFAQALAKLRHPVDLYQMGERLLAVGQYGLAKQALMAAKTRDDSLAPLVANWMSAGVPEAELSPQKAARFEQALALQYHSPSSGGNACSLLRSVTQQGVGSFFPAYRSLGENCSGPEAAQAFRQALEINPDDFQSAEKLGDWALENQRYTEAIQSYRDAMNMIAGKPFAQSRPWVQDLESKLEIAAGASRLEKNPKSASGWLHIGKGLQLQHRTKEAAQAFQNALILQPGHVEAASRRFQTALEQFDWPYLQAHQGRLASLAGSHAMAARSLGYYYMRTRQYGPALSYTQKAIALSPGNGEAYDTLSQIYDRLATQASWQKPPSGPRNVKIYQSKVEAALKKGLASAQNPTERNHLALALGNYLMTHNRSQEAEQYASQVLADEPLNGRAHWLKGKVLFFAGENEQGRDELKTALILLPNDPDVLVALGQIAEEEGREALAMDYYQKAHKADGASYDAAQSLRRLMDKLQVAGKRPPDFMKISADEHDFLVRFVNLSVKGQNATLEVLKAKLAFFGQSSGFNVEHIQNIKKNIELMNQAYRDQLQLYRQIEALQTPPAFASLKYTYLTTHRGLLHVINEALTDNGLFTESQLEQIKEKSNRNSAEMDALQKRGLQAIQQILEKVSKTEMQGIAYEAGWGGAAFRAELKNTQQILSERAEAQKAEEFRKNTGEAMPVPEMTMSKSDKAASKTTTGSAKNPVAGKLAAPAKSVYTPSSR